MRGGKLQNVTDLLSKYKNLRAPQGTVVEAFAQSAEEVLRTPIVRDKITFTPKTRTIHLLFSGPLKQELMLNKQKILKRCTELLGGDSAPKSVT